MGLIQVFFATTVPTRNTIMGNSDSKFKEGQEKTRAELSARLKRDGVKLTPIQKPIPSGITSNDHGPTKAQTDTHRAKLSKEFAKHGATLHPIQKPKSSGITADGVPTEAQLQILAQELNAAPAIDHESRGIPGSLCSLSRVVVDRDGNEFQAADRRLGSLEASDDLTVVQECLVGAFLLLLMFMVYLFTRRFTAPKASGSNPMRIVRKKAPVMYKLL